MATPARLTSASLSAERARAHLNGNSVPRLEPGGTYQSSIQQTMPLTAGTRLGHYDVTALIGEGAILGTLQYMAPEQLEGKEADARTDIFAFGAVVYEMVAGKRAFAGESQASLISSIMGADPAPLASFQTVSPAALQRIVSKCLMKRAEARWHSAHDVGEQLSWLLTGDDEPARIVSPPPSPRWQRLAPWVVAALAVTATVFTLLGSGSSPFSTGPVRLSLGLDLTPIGGAQRSRTRLALSPDGSQVVFVARNGATHQLYLRRLDQPEATPMPGTDGGVGPFFSPDGQWVSFWAAGRLKKVPIQGGPSIDLAELSGPPLGAHWTPAGFIVYANPTGGLRQVSEDGGMSEVITTLDADAGEVSHRLPFVLPGSRAVLYTVRDRTFGAWESAKVVVESLESGERRVVVENAADARFVPTGHLLFVRSATLMAIPFDPDTLTVAGGPVALIDGIAQQLNSGNTGLDSGAAHFTTSGSGTLMYLPGGTLADPRRGLAWYDHQGQIDPLPVEPMACYVPKVSPDGRRIAFMTQGVTHGIWIYEIARGITTRLTVDQDAAWLVPPPSPTESRQSRVGTVDLTSDPDRLARFEREAKVLASLNHPNIGSIYRLEEAEGVRALVLELVEGPTLADRIKEGPIPIDGALPIAKQIAGALEAAHEQGVIHRDLKPANVKVKDDGTVKVLDFGLAKAFQPDASDPRVSMSPTISLTAAPTQMGMVLGTAAYMAPEQASGKVVDKRADVWAFGVVLFEMLTGTRPFVGDDVSKTLAHVIAIDPDWSALPEKVPPVLGTFLRGDGVTAHAVRRWDQQSWQLSTPGVRSQRGR